MTQEPLSLRRQLVVTSEAYCQGRGIALGTLSARLLNRGSRLATIRDERADLTTGSFEAAMAWFSANWPEDVAWPSGVIRPAVDPALVGEKGKGDRAACEHDGKNGAEASASHVNPSADGSHVVAEVAR
ncbi:hypothetical protein [Aurantimonas phage AmM-1]|uniref:hypothetical protein n=1 Tax=Aurantimonas phage AmM-1 TaxID=1503929 RepID=UPI00054086A6|nr:hypothetical protein ACQ23_gp59 [Aurantimonas phage AmM-1]BAP94516.1 hypothetical protein [Aurantimonas phage AmM-1]